MPEVRTIHDVRFTPASRRLVRRGLLGWVAFTVGDGWRVDGVAIRRTRRGRLALSFPSRVDTCGREHPYVLPTRGRRQLEREVLWELGLLRQRQEAHELPRSANRVSRTRSLRQEQPDQPAPDLDLRGPHSAQAIP